MLLCISRVFSVLSCRSLDGGKCIAALESRDVSEGQDLSSGTQELSCCPSEERQKQDLEVLCVGESCLVFSFS